MTIEESVEKGFLNLEENQAKEILDTLFDIEDTENRLGAGMALFQTFVQEDKIDAVLDLAAIILDAYDELGYFEEEDEEHDHEHDNGKEK
ncbi:MAG: hypothetical protein IPP94_03145 [Ignavibacteria bacterium]|jgi:hypothetical protein|nr:hypothetical protein [Ignavibacteria bacterium]